jgi:hypothetical protein
MQSMSTVTRLEPPIPLVTPKGKAMAHFLIDYGFEHHLFWVCFQDVSGECWTWTNAEIRLQPNLSAGRMAVSPIGESGSIIP